MACLVHLQLDRPYWEQCDVYIGPRVPFYARESLWWDAKSLCDNQLSEQERELKYRQYLRRKQLVPEDLGERRLGCACLVPEKCHGRILIDWVRSSPQKFDRPCSGGTCDTSRALFFKGEKSVLSNLSPLALVSGEDCFRNAYQLFIYMKAMALGEQYQYIADAVTSADPLSNDDLAIMARRMHQRCLKTIWTTHKAVSTMYRVLRMKWSQCSTFRSTCMAHQDQLIIEATRDRFWGVGTDLRHATDATVREASGLNIQGWLLKLLSVLEGSCSWSYLRFYNEQRDGAVCISLSLHRGLQIVVESLAQEKIIPYPEKYEPILPTSTVPWKKRRKRDPRHL